jgi:DNA polymerase
MTKLHVDIETFCNLNLKIVGIHRYAEECQLLLFGYSFNKESAKVIDLTKQELPEELLEALQDPNVLKIAHNAAFERNCLSACLGVPMPADQWFCSMAYCAIAGLPLALDQASKVLKTGEQKDAAGKNLIRFFCQPCKPTKNDPGKIRNLPFNNVEKWNQFIDYCRQDIETEKAVTSALSFIKMQRVEKVLWNLDQKINDRGVKINLKFVNQAIKLDTAFRKKLMAEAIKITNLENPNSRDQLIKWINEENDGLPQIDNLRKAEIPDMLEMFDSKVVKRVLNIRQELSKTSVKKYYNMRTCVCKDGRLRGLFQFAGAGRTSRWGGRSSQPHNLPKGHFSDDGHQNNALMDGARNLVLNGDAESIEMIFGPVPDLLSKLLRTIFESANGKLNVSDFSAIEARVIAWLAGEKWRLDIFTTHGKIYEASASKMFKVPVEEVTKGSNYRARGKIAELALGFGGSVGALAKMIKQENVKGIDEKELQPIVNAWRKENPAIVNLWEGLNICAKKVVKYGATMRLGQVTNRFGETLVKNDRGISMRMSEGHLLITLPSGRELCYYKAHIGEGKFGDEVRYYGLDQTNKQWTVIKTYGGKLTENIIQAIARDCLANGMLNLDAAGFEIVLHVHDETANDCEGDRLEEVNRLMIKPAPWMRDLPMRADGFLSDYYKKD